MGCDKLLSMWDWSYLSCDKYCVWSQDQFFSYLIMLYVSFWYYCYYLTFKLITFFVSIWKGSNPKHCYLTPKIKINVSQLIFLACSFMCNSKVFKSKSNFDYWTKSLENWLRFKDLKWLRLVEILSCWDSEWYHILC